jgi:ATP-dependent RNA/DNA helicase IGHMBP2
MDAETYFNHLIALNDAERKAEEEQFITSIKNQSLTEQVHSGICWYPLQIMETGYGFGDYPFVWVERTKQRDLPHNLSPGKPVKLFSAKGNAEDAVIGILDVLRENRAKIVFLTDELPDLLDEGKLVLQAQFDMHSFKRIEEALVLIKNARNCRLVELRDFLIQANSIAEKSDDAFSFAEDANLNDSQNAAVKRILTTQDVAVIHGPPGTGKTTTLVAAAEQICRQDGRVLMAAPSNAAVDHLCMSLIKKGLNVLRLGNPVRISEQLESATLEGKLRNMPEYAVIRDARKQADAYRSMALKYKRQFGAAEREQRKLLLQEAKALVQDANRLEQSLCDALYHSADVICGTLMGVHTHLPKNMEFDFVCIDEAAQAIEPQCWLPFIRAQRIILAGDPYQLPPTVKSEYGKKHGLSITLMEKLLNQVPTVLLDMQYRMNPHIMAFPNQWFYGGKLIAHSSTETRYFKHESGILFVDTAGSGFEEELNAETQSIANRGEVQFIYNQRNSLLPANCDGVDFSVALIAPYSEQVRLLSTQFEADSNQWPRSTRIQSIDSFQGQERDVVLISMVRSNDWGEIGFLRDYRRMNVAMTRARYRLIMLGDSATLSADPFYDALISWCMQQNMYKSVWEFTS